MSAASSDDSNLEQALSTMDVAEQYQTVLRSMVSSSQSSRATSLVAEMTSRGIPLKDDSLRALLDGALDDDAQLPSLLAALRACKQNGALRAFGDASCWSAPERPLGLESLPPLPEDDSNDIAAAHEAAAAGLLTLANPVITLSFADCMLMTSE